MRYNSTVGSPLKQHDSLMGQSPSKISPRRLLGGSHRGHASDGGSSRNGSSGINNGSSSSSSNGSSHNGPSSIDTSNVTSELSSFDDASASDPTLTSFASSLQTRTVSVFSSIHSDLQQQQSPALSLSLSSLDALTSSLFDTSRDSVDLILRLTSTTNPDNNNSKHLFRDPELSSLVVDYFNASHQTLCFCVSLLSSIQKARDRNLHLRLALSHLRDPSAGPSRSLEDLRDFRHAGDPFSPEFFSLLDSVRKEQIRVLESLRERRRKLDRKLKNIRNWRRISSVIFVSLFSAVLICSVVAAAMAAPPVVTALVGVGTAAVGPMGKWFDSLWKGYVEKVERKKKVVAAMEQGSNVVVEELRNVGAFVERLEILVEGMVGNAEFAEKGEEAVRIGVEEIETKIREFMACVEKLEGRARGCAKFVVTARIAVLERIAAISPDT